MPLNFELPKWIARLLSFEGRNRQPTEEKKDEPRIIFTLPSGQKLTTDELVGLSGQTSVRSGKLVGVNGNVRYEVIGPGNIPNEAAALPKQARQAGGRGDYKTAIALRKQASELAPAWTYPAYDLAFTHLLMKDFDGARKYYERTLELSPRGFFTAVTALDTLSREQRGNQPAGTYMEYLSLEWISNQAQRERAIREMVEQFPLFAPAWKEFAALCDDDTRDLQRLRMA
jgi:tetratricopeptide (TPR) repeat protein